jgi:RHS repeat-associated protein
VENDTLAVHRTRNGVPQQVDYDANRAFGIVLYVHGLSTDQPVAVTRVNYADATDLSVGAVTWKVYAPFSTIPLWNSRGRADRAVMGGTASPGGDRICENSSHDRCVELGLVWGEFSYMILADKLGAWQGTLMLDKADATGTFYRRNRSYDPNTARFTQEDPIGLAGGMNLYGFASGDPANYSDPFGLCVDGVSTVLCVVAAVEAGVATTEAASLAATRVVAHVAAAGAALVAQSGLNAANITADALVGAAEAAVPRVHANSLLTTKLTQGYTLRDADTHEILKYGQTTLGKARYTKRYLKDHNADLVFEQSGSKRDMRTWEHQMILEYKRTHNGNRPSLNKSDY